MYKGERYMIDKEIFENIMYENLKRLTTDMVKVKQLMDAGDVEEADELAKEIKKSEIKWEGVMEFVEKYSERITNNLES